MVITMGSVNIVKGVDEATPFIEEMLSSLLPKTSDLLDDLTEIQVEEMQVETPIGETHELHDLTIGISQGELTRYIFSASGHFEPVVEGHVVHGPIFSDLQRRWWFWYLWNVLGGEYVNKTNGFQPPNDYPSTSFSMAEDAINPRLEQFLDELTGG